MNTYRKIITILLIISLSVVNDFFPNLGAYKYERNVANMGQEDFILFDSLYQAFKRNDYQTLAELDASDLLAMFVASMDTDSCYFIPGMQEEGTGTGVGIHKMVRADGTNQNYYGIYFGEYVNGMRSGIGSIFWTKQGMLDYYFLLKDSLWDSDTLTGDYNWKNYITVDGELVEADFTGTLVNGKENGTITCTFSWNDDIQTVSWQAYEGIRSQPEGWIIEGITENHFGIRSAYLEDAFANTQIVKISSEQINLPEDLKCVVEGCLSSICWEQFRVLSTKQYHEDDMECLNQMYPGAESWDALINMLDEKLENYDHTNLVEHILRVSDFEHWIIEGFNYGDLYDGISDSKSMLKYFPDSEISSYPYRIPTAAIVDKVGKIFGDSVAEQVGGLWVNEYYEYYPYEDCGWMFLNWDEMQADDSGAYIVPATANFLGDSTRYIVTINLKNDASSEYGYIISRMVLEEEPLSDIYQSYNAIRLRYYDEYYAVVSKQPNMFTQSYYGYVLQDIDGNEIPELIISTGFSEGERKYYVYTFDGTCRLVKELEAWHNSVYVSNEGISGLYFVSGGWTNQYVSLCTLINGEWQTQEVSEYCGTEQDGVRPFGTTANVTVVVFRNLGDGYLLNDLKYFDMGNAQKGNLIPVSSDTAQLQKDMVTTELDVKSQGITNVESYSNYAVLKKLDLQYNPISDITPLSELTTLEELIVANTNITSLEAIKNLKNLTLLAFGDTLVTDISVVANMPHLKILDFWHCPVSDISALSQLTELEFLSLTGTQVTSIQPIMYLPSLKQLAVRETGISQEEIEQFKSLHPECEVIQ